jgi:hypothetical protein
VDDDALLAMDLDAVIAAASPSPARPSARQPAAVAAAAAGGGAGFVDDDALLAIDLDGIVAAASPNLPTSGSMGLTPEQKQRIAENRANAVSRRRTRLSMLPAVEENRHVPDSTRVDPP